MGTPTCLNSDRRHRTLGPLTCLLGLSGYSGHLWTGLSQHPNWKSKWASAQQKQNDLSDQQRDQHGHLPSLIRAFLVRMKKPWSLAFHWVHSKDCAGAQADLSLCWVHMLFRWFCAAPAQIRNSKSLKEMGKWYALIIIKGTRLSHLKYIFFKEFFFKEYFT